MTTNLTHIPSTLEPDCFLITHYEYESFSPELLHLCKQAKQRKPQQQDLVFWLKRVHKASNQQQAIGIVRLCAMKSHNAGWLIRGLWIAPEHRRKGYASQLMQFAIEIINSKRQHLLFAIADKQLERLYQQLNFLPLAVNDTCVPADIKLHFKQPKSQEKWQIWRLEKTP